MLARLRDRLRPIARGVIVIAALAATGWLGWLLHAEFHASQAAIDAGGVGTADAPYSDALGPWLDSSLSYYLRGLPLSYLYRPTIGLYYSTIISATNSIAAVPVTWIILFFAAGGALFAAAGWGRRTALIGTAAVFILFFTELIKPLNPASLMADFWPMALSLAGIWLVAQGDEPKRPSLAASVAGFLLLGIAGCVRGPQLASGAALLALLAPGRIRRREWWPLLLLVVSFGGAFVVDAVIQKRDHIENQSAVEFYSFYTDPAHRWSMDTHRRYLVEKPSPGEVRAHYLRFLFSPTGGKIFFSNCGSVISQSASLMANKGFLAMLAALALISWLAARPWEPDLAAVEWRWAKKLALAALLAAAAATLYFDTEARPICFACFIGALTLHALLTGRRLTALLTVAFCGALALHAALGLLGGSRLTVGYEVLLFAAIVSAVTERPGAEEVRSGWQRGTVLVIFVLVGVGYTGNFWMRMGFKASLRNALAAPQTAMKVSNSLPLDRSLYMKGDSGVFYTRYDPLPFGTVRRYRPFATPEGIGCATYVHPCNVEWDPTLPPSIPSP